MLFLILSLTFLLDHQVHIVTEMDSVVATVVVVWAEINHKTIFIADLSVRPSKIDMMQMQSYIVTSVKVFPAEVALFIILKY